MRDDDLIVAMLLFCMLAVVLCAGVCSTMQPPRRTVGCSAHDLPS